MYILIKSILWQKAYLSITLCIIWVLFLTACQPDLPRSQPYYYSDEGLEESLPDSSGHINLGDKNAVIAFIKNKTFVSKTEKLVVNDSLYITHFINGKKESVMNCEITEYMVHNNRLLLLTDTATSRQVKYTISSGGILTDMQTYALYSLEK
ncbi:MAG: hypothetical protein M3Q95_07370 [Bacteroidota bacterium]|nr:hypothetical protein [Bacteroidota bacterium]